MSEIITLAKDGAAYVMQWPPRACRCGRMAAFVINRNGATRCLECDRLTATPSEPPAVSPSGAPNA